jgi:hydrogenase-4 membrane subunit HyfE
MEIASWVNKATILASLAIFIVGIATIFLRRHAVWSLVGQLTAVKAVAAAGFMLAQFPISGEGDLVVLSLVALAMVPAVGFVGILVLHRCGRFQGTLDYDEEDSLKN